MHVLVSFFRCSLAGVAAGCVIGLAGCSPPPPPASGSGPSSQKKAAGETESSPAPWGFRPSLIELGVQPWNSEVPFAAHFANDSDRPIEIAAVNLPCNCTSLDASEHTGRRLAPGETIVLSGVLRIGESTGERSVSMEVLLTDGSIHVATLRHSVTTTYTIDPPALEIFRANLDHEDDLGDASSIVRVASENPDFSVTPSADVPWLLVTVVPQFAGVHEVIIQLEKHLTPHGRSTAFVHLRTNDPYKPETSLLVTVDSVAGLRVAPGLVIARQGRPLPIRVVCPRGEPQQIVEFMEGAEGFELVSDNPGRVTLTALRPAEEYAQPHNIRFRTADDRRGRILVRVIPDNMPRRTQ